MVWLKVSEAHPKIAIMFPTFLTTGGAFPRLLGLEWLLVRWISRDLDEVSLHSRALSGPEDTPPTMRQICGPRKLNDVESPVGDGILLILKRYGY